MFDKILCANRGEIAVRIIRACKEMGIKTVAVCSEADKNALHAALADECICVGAPSAAASYLNQQNIISAARAPGIRIFRKESVSRVRGRSTRDTDSFRKIRPSRVFARQAVLSLSARTATLSRRWETKTTPASL